MKPRHFIERWDERGDGSICGVALWDCLVDAIANGHPDMERAFSAKDGSTRSWWRYVSPSGVVFWVLVGDLTGLPITLYDRDQMRHLRERRRMAKRYRSSKPRLRA